MSTTLASFDSGHGDQVHDVQLDYYGKRIATASSDRGIKIFEVAGDQVSSRRAGVRFALECFLSNACPPPPPFGHFTGHVVQHRTERCVRFSTVLTSQVSHLADLAGHEGPVWQVSWGHPKFGGILASCSFDHRVIIWKELHEGSWQQARFVSACTATRCVVATLLSTGAPGSRRTLRSAWPVLKGA